MFKEVFIANHQRGLRFREGHFVAPLPPGRHTVFNPSWDPEHERVEVVDVTRGVFEHPELGALLADGELRRELHLIEVAQGQRAKVFKDGRLLAVVQAGRHAFWRAAGALSVELETMGAAGELVVV